MRLNLKRKRKKDLVWWVTFGTVMAAMSVARHLRKRR